MGQLLELRQLIFSYRLPPGRVKPPRAASSPSWGVGKGAGPHDPPELGVAMLGDPRPSLRQGSHATAARLGQRGWLAETGSGYRAGKTLPTVGVNSFGTPAGEARRGNEVTFLVTSGANFCGRESGAEFAGGESFAQRPEGGPPQGAAASCPVSARVDTRGGPHTSPWEGMPKLVGNPRFNWTDPRIRRSGLFLGVQTADPLAGARLIGGT